MSLYSFGPKKGAASATKERDPGQLQQELSAGSDGKRSGPAIYRPGKAPEWAGDDQSADLLPAARPAVGGTAAGVGRRGGAMKIETGRRAVAAAAIIDAASASAVASSASAAPAAAPARAKREPRDDVAMADDDDSARRPAADAARAIATARVVEPEAGAVDADADAEAEQRRARARARAAARAKEEEEEARAKEAAAMADDKGAAEESEYETDTDAEDDDAAPPPPQLLKPVYRSREQRDTLEERARLEEEEEAAARDRAARDSERKVDSKRLLIDKLKADEEAKKRREQIARGGGAGLLGAGGAPVTAGGAADANLPDDSDDFADPLLQQREVELWKIRELKRIKRDRELRNKQDADEAALAKRRQMTDEEILLDNQLQPSKMLQPDKQKNQYRFLQKYYHSGAFYVDETDPVFQRDAAAPTGADATVDRTLLPAVMQVKKFGVKGRTKYTHLVDQDTSGHAINPWIQSERQFMGVRKTTGQAKGDGAGAGAGAGAAGAGAGAAGVGGGNCFRCGQPGHFAADCPNNSGGYGPSSVRGGGGGGGGGDPNPHTGFSAPSVVAMRKGAGVGGAMMANLATRSDFTHQTKNGKAIPTQEQVQSGRVQMKQRPLAGTGGISAIAAKLTKRK